MHGRRVAANGLAQNLVGRQLGQVLLHQVRVVAVGHHKHVFGRADAGETVHGELEHGAAHAQHVVKLLGVVGAAEGPEPAANAAGHDDEVSGIHGANEVERGGACRSASYSINTAQ